MWELTDGGSDTIIRLSETSLELSPIVDFVTSAKSGAVNVRQMNNSPTLPSI